MFDVVALVGGSISTEVKGFTFSFGFGFGFGLVGKISMIRKREEKQETAREEKGGYVVGDQTSLGSVFWFHCCKMDMEEDGSRRSGSRWKAEWQGMRG